MKISVDPKIFEKAPEYRIGVAVIAGIDNTRAFSREVKPGELAAEEIAAWDKAAKDIGIDIERFPQAGKNLSVRFAKDGKLPLVNPVVDLCNAYSLETGAPVGLHDADKVGGDIEIRPGKEGDIYIPLGKVKGEPVVDPVVYATGSRVLTRNWTWRLSEISKVDQKSKTVVLFIDTFPPIGYDQTLALTKKAMEDITQKFGGRSLGLTVLGKDNPAINIESSRGKAMRSWDKIDEVLTRGVENIIPGKSELEKVLRSDKKLNVYIGIDPTFAKIHLGNLVPLRKLQALGELGHNVTFLIGDFTALIGDTSDKESQRPILMAEEIEANWQTYKQQASKVLDFARVKVVYNSQWLGKLSFTQIVKLCQHFSVGDFVSRELIRRRIDIGKRVGLHEMLYPVMQGYDSYFMDTDIQLGGTDQTFNMQAGRTLQRELRRKESYIIANAFLAGTDGRKMSKSWGNAIWVDDSPDEMYGKSMSVGDDLIIEYLTLGTNLPMEEVEAKRQEIIGGENPMNVKKELAFQIVAELHGTEEASKAQEKFRKTFQSGQAPSDVLVIKIGGNRISAMNLVGILVAEGLIKSKSEGRRLIEQGGFSVVGKRSALGLGDFVSSGDVVRIGKKLFIKAS
jgi:tyrosyl-tRNA synthetase